MFDSYFDDPDLGYVTFDPKTSLYTYGVRIHSALFQEDKFLFVQSPIQYKTPVKMSGIQWYSIQTRILEKNGNKFSDVPSHSYSKKEIRIPVSCAHKGETYSTYYCDLPLEIILLHPDKRINPFGDHGTIGSCLETFYCIIKRI